MKFFSVVQKRFRKRLFKVNQLVQINEILVNAGEGEYVRDADLCVENFANLQGRLMAHIEQLAMLANTDHLFRNYKYRVKAGHENCVTRLSTNEFSFYTKHPLLNNQFLSLIACIEKLASRLLPNLHLLLSSFAVTIDEKIFNLAIYVQCGPIPTLNVFVKASPSTTDLEYPLRGFWCFTDKIQQDDNLDVFNLLFDDISGGNTNEVQLPEFSSLVKSFNYLRKPDVSFSKMLDQFLDKLDRKILITCDELEAFNKELDIYYNEIVALYANPREPLVMMPEQKKQVAVSHDSVLIATTSGGAKFWVVNDICLDFKHGRGRSHLKKQIRVACSTEVLPSQVSHVVTSNTISFGQSTAIGRFVVHADADLQKCGIVDISNDQELLRPVLSPECLASLPGATLSSDDKCLVIKQPNFGSKVRITFYAPYVLGTLPEELDMFVRQHNKNAVANSMDNNVVPYVPEQRLALTLR